MFAVARKANSESHHQSGLETESLDHWRRDKHVVRARPQVIAGPAHQEAFGCFFQKTRSLDAAPLQKLMAGLIDHHVAAREIHANAQSEVLGALCQAGQRHALQGIQIQHNWRRQRLRARWFWRLKGQRGFGIDSHEDVKNKTCLQDAACVSTNQSLFPGAGKVGWSVSGRLGSLIRGGLGGMFFGIAGDRFRCGMSFARGLAEEHEREGGENEQRFHESRTTRDAD